MLVFASMVKAMKVFFFRKKKQFLQVALLHLVFLGMDEDISEFPEAKDIRSEDTFETLALCVCSMEVVAFEGPKRLLGSPD